MSSNREDDLDKIARALDQKDSYSAPPSSSGTGFSFMAWLFGPLVLALIIAYLVFLW